MAEKNRVLSIESGSIADELGITPGDIVLDINGKKIKDIFDYRYLMAEEFIELDLEKPSGEQWVLEIEKDEYEDLGIVFENGLMDNSKGCLNNCIFCFISQLPKNMRKTLYFKDDDPRLSFLQGNYVTLTNMEQDELDRIIFYHLSPINISVHTTNMALREAMLRNVNSSNLMSCLKKLFDANIDMHFQIVLCKGINDCDELDKTIEDLSAFRPKGKSLSVVPVGLTRYRDGLKELLPFTKEDCANIIKQIQQWQNIFLKKFGTRFVYAADEFYLKACMDFPCYEEYEDFPQIENGVGMLSLMQYEFDGCLSVIEGDEIERSLSIATGAASFEFILSLAEKIKNKFINTEIHVYLINNDFFGENITVSGLLTGRDIIKQLTGKSLGNVLFIPENSLRDGDTVFLDDIDIKDVERKLNVTVLGLSSNGEKFIKEVLGN